MKVYLLAKVSYEDFEPQAVYPTLERAKAATKKTKWWDNTPGLGNEVTRAKADDWYDYAIYEIDSKGL